MAEYIKREDALAIINASNFDLEYNADNIALQEAIKLIPAADVVEQKPGKWIDYNPDNANDPRMKCSNCNCVETPLAKWRYCPVCMAKME